MLGRIFNWVLDHLVITCLSVLLFSFVIATIALAAEKDSYKSSLDTCNAEKDALLTTSLSSVAPTSSPSKSSSQQTTSQPPQPPQGKFRLNPDVVPASYEIQLHPNFVNDSFEGSVKINLEVFTPQEQIQLHSNLLSIDGVGLQTAEGISINTTHALREEDEVLVIHRSGGIFAAGSYVLLIEFHAKLTGEVGFYMSKLNDGSKIATSKFEPTYARQAFPCFDEPAMKAKYSVKIVVSNENNNFALSNMNVVSKDPFDNFTTTYTFNESVPMSTYLACFIVCNFEYKENKITQSQGEFPLRVYATEYELSKVDFPLEIGTEVTEYYIDYFKIDYPLPKLDMIGIPDFVSGAMEHWGLVTFRETSLLYDPKTTSTATKQNIARVVAHEIAHMWFGNLVTMAWWDELWLNEGFASYMQYKALQKIHPEWKTLEQFLSSNTHSVMALDATLASHPIVVKVETPDEITAIFDSISYNKGAAVLRMLEAFVGEENFQKGVTDYLNQHKYNNTITKDLLDKLAVYFNNDGSALTITHIMDTWTRQMGLPLVTVVDNSDGSYTLTQKRFLTDPEGGNGTASEFNYRWCIPITYTTSESGSSNKTVWFSNEDEKVTITPPNNEKIIKLNNDQVGYYRVNYSASMWSAIERDMSNKTSKLTISDKGNILNDVFSLAESDPVLYERALDISRYLGDETEYLPWAVASAQFSSLNRIMSNSLAYTEFQTYITKLVHKVVNSTGWNATDENEEHIKNMTRSVVLNLACSFGDEECLETAKTKFVDWLDKGTEIHPDIKGIVYYYGIERTEDSHWSKFYELYMNVTDAQEKSRMMQSLAASRNPARLKWYLMKAWDEKVVRSQDYFSVMQYISANPVGTPIVWDYFRENWDRIKERFTLNSRTLGTTVPAITRTFATNQKLEEMKAFFDANPEAGAGATARQQAIEAVTNNIKWMREKEPHVAKWLSTATSLF